VLVVKSGSNRIIIRVEADVKHSTATPKTVDEALAELESKVGALASVVLSPDRPALHYVLFALPAFTSRRMSGVISANFARYAGRSAARS
jgi:hypothetical protein